MKLERCQAPHNTFEKLKSPGPTGRAPTHRAGAGSFLPSSPNNCLSIPEGRLVGLGEANINPTKPVGSRVPILIRLRCDAQARRLVGRPVAAGGGAV
jgi:hypothetical protein